MKYRELTISIAKSFSRTPGGRHACSGKHSAEEFRERLLVPALLNADKVIVNLDGTAGYAASFLEEAFGGTARELGVEFVKEKIEFVSDETPRYIKEVQSYIDEA